MTRNGASLMSGIPELLLVSAVYLGTLFPDAIVRFADSESTQRVWDQWTHVDFVFAADFFTLDLTAMLEGCLS